MVPRDSKSDLPLALRMGQVEACHVDSFAPFVFSYLLSFETLSQLLNIYNTMPYFFLQSGEIKKGNMGKRPSIRSQYHAKNSVNS